VGAPGEDDEFVVFLNGHDDFMSEIIRDQPAIPPYKKAFVSGGPGMNSGYAGKNKNAGEYLSGFADNPESVRIVCQERSFESDVFFNKRQGLKETISAGGLTKIYLGVRICLKELPETATVIEMMMG